MPTIRNWQFMNEMAARLLEERTGQNVAAWNERIKARGFVDPAALRAWLTAQGVAGYPRALLLREAFGHPDFLTASAEELISAQYSDRQHLRPIFDAIVDAAAGLGELVVQARKTYVSLVTPHRTFARIQPTTRKRIDLGLRLERRVAAGRLQPSRIHETMPLQFSLASISEVDAEVLEWLRQAYEENC
jgi:hypothetical protein